MLLCIEIVEQVVDENGSHHHIALFEQHLHAARIALETAAAEVDGAGIVAWVVDETGHIVYVHLLGE